MKKFVSLTIIISIIIQAVGLYLFFYEKLSKYPVKYIDIIWVGSALLSILFGAFYFILNRKTKAPMSTVISVAWLGIIGFELMTFKNWMLVLVLVLFTFGLHFYRSRENKFTIFPVISIIMGIYSIGLLLLMLGITSM